MTAILTYTALCLKDIENLSFPQYKEIINAISKKINWDLQLSIVGTTGQLEMELNPLYPDETESERVFKISDAKALENNAGKQ